MADAVARLNELKSRGVDSIVDLTVIGLALHPRIERVAAQTNLNIVVATGVYTYNDVPMYFHFSGPGTPLGEPMVDMFVGDIEQGIAGTGVKAAILKCATDEPGVTPASSGCCALSRRRTGKPGVPISTHTHAGNEARARAATHLRRRGCRPVQGGDRSLRRHHRSRLSRGTHRRRLLHRHGPVRRRRLSADSRTG